MRKFLVCSASVVTASALLPVLAFAQAAAPTTATGLAAAVDMSDAKAAGLLIVGALITVGVVLWGARLVMSKFRPKV